MPRRNKLATVTPRIAVLEGLYADTVDIIEDAGGIGEELDPWKFDHVEKQLKSGRYDGLILTGGSDVSPSLYGETPHKESYGFDYARDACEIMALEYATKQGIPVLGICRGSQIMNVYRGGSLRQHIEGHRGGTHDVFATERCRTFTKAVRSRESHVVSLHHQCVKRLGQGLRLAATDEMGIPEAIESKDGLWLGCQYHPEMAAYEEATAFAVFQWLVATAAKQMGGKAQRTSFKKVRARYEAGYSAGKTYASSPYGSEYEGDYARDEDGRFLTAEDYDAASVKLAKEGACPCENRNCSFGFTCGRGWERTEADKKKDKQKGKNRKAGDRTGPTACETPRGEACDLFLCAECGMLFDHKIDRDDHEAVIHNGENLTTAMERRYPELMAPIAVETDEQMVQRMLLEAEEAD